MVIDDRLNVLPISSQTLKITPLAPTTKVQYQFKKQQTEDKLTRGDEDTSYRMI